MTVDVLTNAIMKALTTYSNAVLCHNHKVVPKALISQHEIMREKTRGTVTIVSYLSGFRVKYSRLSTKEMYSQDGIRYYSVRADEKSNFSNCTSR